MKRPVKLSQLESPRLTALIYGAPGVGKTVLACGSQRLRALLLDVDKGAISARTWAGSPTQGLGPTQLERVEVLECDSLQDVIDGIEEARRRAKEFDLLIVDSMTELQRAVLTQIKEKGRSEIVDQRGWGIALDAMDALLRSMKQLPMHLVCTAHEVVSESGEHVGKHEYRPAFQGALKDWYARHFTLVARYTHLQEEFLDSAGKRQTRLVRALQCHRTPQAHGKDRVGALNLWEPPSLDHVLDKIQQKLTETKQQAVSAASTKPAAA